MKQFVKWIQGSFEVDGGASARKISAFTIIVLVVMAHISWLKNSFINDNFSLLSEILIIDFSFISALLGMKTWEGVQKMKNDKQNTPITP